MSTISAISSGSASSTADVLGASGLRVPQKQLGQDDFMKLLAVQFQMQDPMKPMEDSAFIAQSAQFAALQQSTAMTQQLAQLRTDQQQATANSYLGLRVSVDAGSGEIVTGTVTRVTIENGEPRLELGERAFPLSAVLAAEPASGPVPAPASGKPGSV